MSENFMCFINTSMFLLTSNTYSNMFLIKIQMLITELLRVFSTSVT